MTAPPPRLRISGSASDENSSCWVRVSSPWAGSGFGGVQLPNLPRVDVPNTVTGAVNGTVNGAVNGAANGVNGALGQVNDFFAAGNGWRKPRPFMT